MKVNTVTEIPISEVYEMIKSQLGLSNVKSIEPKIKTMWVGDQRDGHNETKLQSIIIKH